MTCRCQSTPGYWWRATCRDLTHDERAIAAAVGLARHEASWGTGVDSVNPKARDRDLEVNILGATAEAAFAILFGLPWAMSVNAWGEPDFPPDLEVRCRDGWRNLIVREADIQKERRYIAGVLEEGVFRFYGWCWSREAEAFPLSDPTPHRKPARFIPVEALHRLPLDMRHEALHG